MDGAIGRQQRCQFGRGCAGCALATPRRRLVVDVEAARQPAHQRLQARVDSASCDDGPAPGGDYGIGIGPKMPAQSLVEAGLDSREAAESLGRRQFRKFLIARRILQRGQGEEPLGQRAPPQEAFRRLDADQIVDQLRRLARRRREFGSLGPAKIESADGALELGSESALVEGRETLAASRTAIDQAPAMTSAGHDAGAPPGPPEISRLVVGEALRAELQPRRAHLAGPVQTDGMAERQKQGPPISASDCHRRDPIAANAGLTMQQVQEGRRRLEIEPRRPSAGAEPEAVPKMARRQAMGESETMLPAREQLVLRRDHLRRPAFGHQGREPRLHFDRGAAMFGQRRPIASLGAAAPCGARTAACNKARIAFAA